MAFQLRPLCTCTALRNASSFVREINKRHNKAAASSPPLGSSLPWPTCVQAHRAWWMVGAFEEWLLARNVSASSTTHLLGGGLPDLAACGPLGGSIEDLKPRCFRSKPSCCPLRACPGHDEACNDGASLAAAGNATILACCVVHHTYFTHQTRTTHSPPVLRAHWWQPLWPWP